MLGKGIRLMVISLAVAGALAACSSANTSAMAVPVWDYRAAATGE